MSESLPPVRESAIPPDTPDKAAEAEKRDLDSKPKPPTPTEREAASHLSHLDTHRERINHHCAEVAELKAELQAVRQRLEESQVATGHRDARIKELETASRYGGRLFVLGTAATLLGACFSGVAGGTPIPDVWKVAFSAAGVAMTLVGAAIVVTVAWLGHR